MSPSPAWFKFYPDDWFGGVVTMTRLERSVYLDLLMLQWKAGAIPASPKRLAALLGMSLTEFEEVWRDSLHAKFQQHPDDPGQLVNPKMAAVRAEAHGAYEQRQEASRRGVEARRRKAARPSGQPDGRPSGQPSGAPGPQPEPRTQNPEPKNPERPDARGGARGGDKRRGRVGPEELDAIVAEAAEPQVPLADIARVSRSMIAWAEHRRESKLRALTSGSWRKQAVKALHDPDLFERSVDHSIAQGYQGIYPPKELRVGSSAGPQGEPRGFAAADELQRDLERRGIA